MIRKIYVRVEFSYAGSVGHSSLRLTFDLPLRSFDASGNLSYRRLHEPRCDIN